jgi:hypothetical protein
LASTISDGSQPSRTRNSLSGRNVCVQTVERRNFFVAENVRRRSLPRIRIFGNGLLLHLELIATPRHVQTRLGRSNEPIPVAWFVIPRYVRRRFFPRRPIPLWVSKPHTIGQSRTSASCLKGLRTSWMTCWQASIHNLLQGFDYPHNDKLPRPEQLPWSADSRARVPRTFLVDGWNPSRDSESSPSRDDLRQEICAVCRLDFPYSTTTILSVDCCFGIAHFMCQKELLPT